MDGKKEARQMSDNSNLTCKEFLEAILAKISVEAKNPELFTKYGEWNDLTSGLNDLVEELKEENDADKRQVIELKRDAMVRELIILMRNQFVHSYPFDDLWLQASLGCTILHDYAELKKSKALGLYGHKFDGIEWNVIELSMMPDHPKRRFDFRGTETEGWEYCSCLDHAISNLICKAWGFSGYRKGLKSDEPDDPETKFKVTFWQDASLYLAVLLCFGDNILNDQKFLREIGANLDKDDTPQKKLYKVLSVSEIRGKLRKRIQGHIKEDDSKSPDRP